MLTPRPLGTTFSPIDTIVKTENGESNDADASNAGRLGKHYRRRFWSGGILLVLMSLPATIHSAAAIGTLRNLPAEWLPWSLPIRQDFIRFMEQFGVTDVIFASWPGCRLGDPSVDRVTSVLRQLMPADNRQRESSTAKSGANASEQAVDPAIAEFWEASRRINRTATPIQWCRSGTEIHESLQSPPLRASHQSATRRLLGTLIGEDRSQTCILIALDPDVGDRQRFFLPRIRDVVASIAGVPPDRVAMVGGPVDGAAVDSASIQSIQRYSVPSSFLAAVLCWLCLRSVPLTAAVVGVATVGQGMVLALVYYLGTPMNAVLIVLPPLVFVLTVSAGIHLSNYFLDIAGRNDIDWALAARQAMHIGTAPCCMATFTTVIGLLSLTLVRLQPVRTFGAVASMGVLGTLAMLLWILPGAMVYAGPGVRRRIGKVEIKPENDGFGRWLHPAPIVLLFVLIAMTAGAGVSYLRTSVSVPEMFLPDSDLRTQYRWYESNIGGTISGDLLIRFPRSAPSLSTVEEFGSEAAAETMSQRTADHKRAASRRNQIDVMDELRTVTSVHAALMQVDAVGGVMSAMSFLPPPASGNSLRSVARRGVIRGQLSNTDKEVYRLGYVSDHGDERSWRIGLRFFQKDSDRIDANLREVQQAADAAVSELWSREEFADLPRPVLTMTGHIVIVQRSQQLLLNDLFNSFLAAFVTILGLMTAYLRSLIGGLVSMIPNVIPTLMLFGTMGWIDVPLDIGSVMTASLALGIAIDDTVHLLSRYRQFRRHTDDRRSAALSALRQCGWAMLQTTLVCGLSLVVYGLSDFVPTRRFALFLLGLLAVAWIGVATLLPALMATRAGNYLAKQRRPIWPFLLTGAVKSKG